MTRAIDRLELLAAFDEIGEAATRQGAVLHIAVYGGSALMLASNFRYSSEDVDIAELPKPWPKWLADTIAGIAASRGWSEDWLSEAVDVHLSHSATIAEDHLEFGTFPRSDSDPGLVVYVPTAEYMLALKLKAVRVLDPVKGQQEAEDIRNLMRASAVGGAEEAVAVMARYFPRSAADPAKQFFLLRHILKDEGSHAAQYPVRSD